MNHMQNQLVNSMLQLPRKFGQSIQWTGSVLVKNNDDGNIKTRTDAGDENNKRPTRAKAKIVFTNMLSVSVIHQ